MNEKEQEPRTSTRNRGLMAWPEDVDRFFQKAFQWSPPLRRLRTPWVPEQWLPDIDIFEKDGKLVIRADVPGIKKEDLDITLANDTLTISGRREEESEIKEDNYYRLERSRGEFSRTIPLPEGVKPESVEAACEDGVLELTIEMPPEEEQRKASRIQVK